MIKSNTTNERKSEQAFIPHAPTLCDSVAQNLWQCHAFWIGQSDKKIIIKYQQYSKTYKQSMIAICVPYRGFL